MKIIHTADIHIGSAIKNLPNKKARQRRQEALTAFRYVADYAKANGVTAVLICGDLFDEGTLSSSVMQETFSVISSVPQVCFFYCQGNHDKYALQTGGIPKNLFLFSDAHGFKSYSVGGNILITGSDGNYLTAEAYTRLNLPKDAYNIVMAHGELSALCGKDLVCLPMLQNKNIDYLALGHIHNADRTQKPLQLRGGYRYSGCLFSRGFDECGEKGFYEIEIKNGRMIAEKFIVVPTVRTVNSYMVDVSACQTLTQLENSIASVLQKQHADGVVKLVLKGVCLPSLKKYFYQIEGNLSHRFFFLKLEDKTTPALEQSELLRSSPLLNEFARILQAQTELVDKKEDLLDIAVKALTGEDLEI